MTVLTWLRGKFSLNRRRQNPLVDDIEFPDSTHVLLIGFSYDRPTREMYKWISEILSAKTEADRVFRFDGTNFSKKELSAKLEEELERVEIFCGHGSSKGLYGPPHNELSPDIFKELHHIVYDSSMQRPGPSSMFAFCCGTASEFGREFIALRDNRFIGFVDDIPIANDLYRDLKLIFQTLAKGVIEKGKIEQEHGAFFQKEISTLLREIKANPSRYALPETMGSILMHYQDSFRSFV